MVGDFSHRSTASSRPKQANDGPITSSSLLSLKAELAKKKSDGGSHVDRRSREGTSTGHHKRKTIDDHDEYKVQSSALKSQFLPRSSSSTSGKKSKSSSSKDGGQSTLSSWSNTPSAQLERDRNEALERKARMYDQLQKGLSGGFRPEDLEEGGRLEGLVDWIRKRDDGERRREELSSTSTSSGEDDDDHGGEGDEILVNGEGDRLVEFIDDLGRTRMLPRSQVPMEYLERLRQEASSVANDQEDHLTIHGRQTHFPVLNAHASSSSSTLKSPPPPTTHFDSSFEIRNRGAGFYRFDSTDEEGRRRQMEELKAEREQTERQRAKLEHISAETASQGDESRPQLFPFEERLAKRRAFVQAKKRELALARQGERMQDDEDPNHDQDETNSAAVDHFLESLQRDLATARKE